MTAILVSIDKYIWILKKKKGDTPVIASETQKYLLLICVCVTTIVKSVKITTLFFNQEKIN